MDKTYRIADFRALERPAVYADNYYFALSPLRDYPALCKGVMVYGLLFLFCLDGEVSLKVNDCPLTIVAGDLLVAPPNTMLDDIRPSSGGSAVLVGYSIDILVRMLTGSGRVMKVIRAFAQKRVINNDERYTYARVNTFLNILRYRNAANDLYHDELVYHLFAAMLFDVINDLHIPEGSDGAEVDGVSHYRTEHLYKQFLALLNKEDGRVRLVSYYADKLYITPKYLSKITNIYEGRPALDVITSHAVERLKIELRYTDRPMKDIADEFRFESYSSFRKFIKKHLGCTPQQYRQASAKV